MGKSYLKELRTDLTNFIIATVTYSAIVIIPAFYWRLFQERDATYHFAMVVPLFCGAVLLVLHIGRDRFNPTLRALTLSTLFVFMGISGLLARGILGPAFFFMMLAIICLSLILPLKKMLIAACLIVGVFIALVAGYLSGVIIINVNPEQVFASNAAWIAYLMVPVYCCFLVIFSFNRYNRMVETLMSELDEERAEVIKLANRDPLTNLYNLRAASYRAKMTLSMAKRQHKKVALLFIDLDEFKTVNDQFGHGVGNQLLIEVAARLQNVIRENDTLARLGGDEFLILLSDLEQASEAMLVVERIRKLINTPFELGPHQCKIGVSIGVSVYPEDGDDFEILMRRSDKEMYRNKNEYRKNKRAFETRSPH